MEVVNFWVQLIWKQSESEGIWINLFQNGANKINKFINSFSFLAEDAVSDFHSLGKEWIESWIEKFSLSIKLKIPAGIWGKDWHSNR